MKRIIFLDRDGTLNRDDDYAHKVEDYELLSGVKDGLKRLQNAGYDFIILTSQSGIGRGMYTEADYSNFNSILINDLKDGGINILSTYFCPHHVEYGLGKYKVDCVCRKPKPGLLMQAEKDYGPFDYKSSWSIGDSARDIQMAKNVSSDINGIIIPKNYGTKSVKPLDHSTKVDFMAKNFLEAVEIILNN